MNLAPMTESADPTTPRKSEAVKLKINSIVGNLNWEWDLRLELPPPLQSPDKRAPTTQQRCVSKITFLCFKGVIKEPREKFNLAAEDHYIKWVRKPNIEQGVIPERTRHKPHPVTGTVRTELINILHDILSKAVVGFQIENPHSTGRSGSFRSSTRLNLDDSPIPIPFPKSANKRCSDDRFDEDVDINSKKLKQPESVIHPTALRGRSVKIMPPPDRGRQKFQEARSSRSANTSFASTSNISSVFSAPGSMHMGTQETVSDDDEESKVPTQPNTRPSSPLITTNTQSSEYEGGSSFEQHVARSMDANGMPLGSDIIHMHVDEELSQDMNEVVLETSEPTGFDSVKELLQDRLRDVFPALTPYLVTLPFPVLYEITRICLYTDVPLESLPITVPPKLNDYDTLWTFLKSLPPLKDKTFPQRCGKDVWSAARDGFARGPHAVVLSGSLCYSNSSPAGPFFRFRLEPMRFDLSYRLGRRFGNDRFLEIDIPQISGHKVPQILKDLGEKGQRLLVKWLVDEAHHLLGRTWKPFHLKRKERRDCKREVVTEDLDTAYRVYLFAERGYGFQLTRDPLVDPQNCPVHETKSIKNLLESVRLSRKNQEQSFLKLFTRTDLVVSKNTATVELVKSYDTRKTSQIQFADDIRCGEEVMTDGAGQLSPKLALAITMKLGLSYVPSGFQGRIGEAKGFWSIDYQDQSGKEWIRVYESQRKWVPSMKEDGENNHKCHRTFEVLRFSGPLKPADLNLQFLPLLQDRATEPKEMESALRQLLEEGLQRQLLDLQTAMNDPKSFRKWLRETNSGINERLKNGSVPYRAGLPVTIEERLNMLLDAGFDPNKLYFLKELARIAFKTKCDDLEKRLNITVSRSTYAYMVPDFTGVLEPNEVYLDFSNFVDESTGFSDVRLNGVDILVARSPAHYVSDIQKVRAVHKVQLMGLKDVIVFSTKGNPSLANKLSGGDYDGDIAWVCWESSIVENFNNAEVPEVPDLVKEGFLYKNETTYAELVGGKSDPTSVFLNESFLFNMQQSMLGICTAFKESVCYSLGSVNTTEAVYLSTLLSKLVDQSKQGFSFTHEGWDRFKKSVIKFTPRPPSYKGVQIDRHSKHIIDKLMIAAKTTIQKLLTEFQDHTKDPPKWDEDLVKYYNWARSMAEDETSMVQKKARERGATHKDAVEEAKRASEWQSLLDHLDEEIKRLKALWGASTSHEEEAREDYMVKVDRCYEVFRAIRPHVDTPLTQSLLPGCLNEEFSNWSLLKASAFFASYRRKPTRLVWNIAGKQLARLKADYSGGGFPHVVIPGMYAMLKPDASYVKRSRCQGNGDGPAFDENSSVVNADEIENFED